ncbi:Chemotaxis protein CheW [Pelotomaculum sp. FP]|uniref:chemotaxis protein CheW n=1 Tax=Pelotomaculum sp. FP TaxID=261474 RepID=UPI001105119B|nr:chemotaxis protein CheW [Pelotomaculum sp. FP]TEB15529.1 Chemotaxis protein CheW [Pelotomaculum sp. FP]
MSLKERWDDEPLEDDDEDTQEDKFLTFFLNREEFGIEIRYVMEIIGIQNITEVPDVPRYIKGVINLRGKVIPVMDVRLRFEMEERAYDDRTCIVVICIDEQSVGLIVDRVSEVLDIPKGNIEPPPKGKRGENSRFIQGMGKAGEQVIILLNANQLLFDFTQGDDH